MDAKESLLFVGKCLTLDHYPHKASEIKKLIRANEVDWEKVVWAASGQLVIPALYLNLKRASLLPELPEDLIEHLKEITDLNRERNHQIIKQAKQVTALLNKFDMEPIFLKGVANLLIGLYVDPAERMIGDIDFLVPSDQMVRAAGILIGEGYKPLAPYHKEAFIETKHYPRLVNPDCICAIEIHKEVLIPPNHKNFMGKDIIHKRMLSTYNSFEIFTPSIKNLIIHNVYNSQINDKAFIYGNTNLRQMYDLYLLSFKENILEVAEGHGYRINIFNTYFALISMLFSQPNEIHYKRNWKVSFFISRLNLCQSYPFIYSYLKTTLYLYHRITRYFSLLIRSLYNKNTRMLLIYRLRNPKWYKAHFKSYLIFFKS